LKTVEGNTSGGSNPSLPATTSKISLNIQFLLSQIVLKFLRTKGDC